MGQAFRRASGRIRASSSIDSTPSTVKTKSVVDRKPLGGRTDKVEISRAGSQDVLDSDNASTINANSVLEERDPKFDAMLSQMVGRVTAKSGGKLKMGEAFVVERYNRPMPKLRNTKSDSGRYEDRPAPPGTLNVAQLRHIILLYQGKADDHDGPMDASQIAEKFQVDVSEIQRIVQVLSLPPEDDNKKKTNP